MMVRRKLVPLAVAALALALGLPRLAAQDAPKKDEPKKDEPKKDEPKKEDGKSGKTGDGKSGDDDEDAPSAATPESPNTKLPDTASATLKKAVEAFKAGYARYYKEGFAKAKADLYEAVKLLRRAREEDMNSPLPLYYIGILNQLEGDDKHAVENLKVVVRIAPKFWEAWTELGDAHAHLGQMKDSEEAYGKALELKPDWANAWLGRCVERLQDGRYKDALDDAKKGLKACPKDVRFVWLAMRAKTALNGPNWKQTFTKESEHYIIKTDVDQPYADWIANQAELIRKVYVKVFEKCHLELPKRKYTVFVSANAQEYHENGGPQHAGGHYDPELKQLFLYRYDDPADAQIVMYHEAFHQFLHPYLSRAPQWFNEGLGDYFGGAHYVKSPVEGMEIKPNRWRVATIKRGVETGQVAPLKTLLNMTQAELYDEKTVGMNYAQSWSFIYFLCQYQGGQYFPLLGKYFNALRGGKTQEEAYKAAFGDQNMDKIDEEWRAFVAKM